jgi:phosphoribosylformylglycinamidine cyclo-ligase
LPVTYQDAGVDLKAAEESTRRISRLARSTFNRGVLKDIGLFSAFYQIDKTEYEQPVIVSSIDGVGTKLKIAFLLNVHNTVGQDLVNHCINDIMTSGADPLFFLDYIGTRSLDPRICKEIVGGMAKACKENGCALIGGETAEMPGFYLPGEYDLAGAIVGIVEKENIIDGSKIKPGNVLVGLPSNGLHTNGYSLARKVLLESKKIKLTAYDERLGDSWGNVLLKIHRSYLHPINRVKRHSGVLGISHITGGGIVGNTSRLLQAGQRLHIRWDAWKVPEEFRLIQEYGDITDEEMRKTFNLGIGLIFVVEAAYLSEIIHLLESARENPLIVGNVGQDVEAS